MEKQITEINLLELLQKETNHENFRPGQELVIRKVLSGENVLGVMPTGTGKSLCYQLPALLYRKASKGMVIVISPLIALMNDQVESLKNMNINASFLNSSKSHEQQVHTLTEIAQDEIDVLFVAPERLKDGLFLSALKKNESKISLCVIDEAHCISEWGHDFRGDYLFIEKFIVEFNHPQILALTATASEEVKLEIKEKFKISKTFDTFPVFRKNLQIQVKKLQESTPDDEVLRALQHFKSPGIIYINSREKVERLCNSLNNQGYNSRYYHGDIQNKDEIYRDFMEGKIDVLVATKAFGMGIDKNNIRFIIHYQLPDTIDSYIQEIGRGGRDGKTCNCLLLYNTNGNDEIKFYKSNITKSYPQKDKIREMFHNTLALGYSKYGKQKKMTSEIPFSTFQDSDNAMKFLYYFEAKGLIQVENESISQLEVSIVSDKLDETTSGLLTTLLDDASKINIKNLAEHLNITEFEALDFLYALYLDKKIQLKSREMRYLSCKKLKGELDKELLNELELDLKFRKEKKLERLYKMVEYAENVTTCRNEWLSSYYRKDTNIENCNCDICMKN